MKEINIIDNFLDEREFRNTMASLLTNMGYNDVKLDDARFSDNDETNNNDMTVIKDDKKYTVQTFLNTEITEKEIDETKEDIIRENVIGGIIITNTKVIEDIKLLAEKEQIIVIDRDILINSLNENK